jgi:uncharacterized protein YbjT (DUF2867 family)
MSRIAVVAGATGLVGGALLRRLAAQHEYAEVRVLGRRPPSYEAGKLRFIHADFEDLAAVAAELAVDDIYCCLGTTLRKAGGRAAFERVDYHMVVNLARAAHQAGAKRLLVISAVGASVHAPAFYSRVKARMEQAVSEIPFAAVHILRPSLLLGARDESRPAEFLGQKAAPLLAPLLMGPLKKYRPVEAANVADAMVRLALSDATGVRIHHFF